MTGKLVCSRIAQYLAEYVTHISSIPTHDSNNDQPGGTEQIFLSPRCKNQNPDTCESITFGTNSVIHELYVNPGETFSLKSDQSPHWDMLDTQGPGAIAGIGWSAQVRLYYVSVWKVVQTALRNDASGSAANL